MITIDQLLESVDLDFEPRWVTKDSDGTIICWAGEPRQSTATQAWIQINPYCCGKNIARCLKLAEFENKDWQECIYEVPRKTIGKIEKLNLLNDSALLWGKKINELVDMVNNIISVQEKMIDSRFIVDVVNELKENKGVKNG